MADFLAKDIRQKFPTLSQRVNDHPLVYLDSGATTLKPKIVVDRMADFYSNEVSNVHRGAHYLSDAATDNFEKTRKSVCRFIGASNPNEIIFTSGTTDSINLLATSLFTSGRLHAGDEIILSQLEHHSNIVPWYQWAQKTGVILRVAEVTDQADFDFEHFKSLLSEKTKLVSVVHVSNSMGTICPVKDITDAAHSVGALVHFDGAQALSCMPVNLSEIGCDFYSFSAHKLFGPNGVGVLFGKEELLNSLPPYRGGGSMIDQVSFEKVTYLKAPHRFEAGTPNIAGVVAFREAIDFVSEIGMDSIFEQELELTQYGINQLAAIEGVKLIGAARSMINILSFIIEGTHPSDVGAILDQQGIALRCGHHCCMPIMKRFGVPGTIRASLSIYNNKEDIDALVRGIQKAKEFLL